MKVIGLTGNIACGKSTVSKMLGELGAFIIDADIVARQVVEKGQPAWYKIKENFGNEYFMPDGSLNRRKLANLVFNDQAALQKLNSITHPIIVSCIKEQLEVLKAQKSYSIVVIDAALLIETGCHLLTDEVWLVIVSHEIQVKRLMKRDNLTFDQATARIFSQGSLYLKKKYATYIIDNSFGIQCTKEQVIRLWKKL